MPERIHGDPDGGVSDDVGDDLKRDAHGEHEGGRGMPQLVHAPVAEARGFVDLGNGLAEDFPPRSEAIKGNPGRPANAGGRHFESDLTQTPKRYGSPATPAGSLKQALSG
jgi:hypothetical protein